VQSILNDKVSRALSEMQTASGETTLEVSFGWKRVEDLSQVLKTPISLASLCSACFGTKPKLAMICFDGCMQQKRMKLTGQNDTRDERRLQRLFVDQEALLSKNEVCSLMMTI